MKIYLGKKTLTAVAAAGLVVGFASSALAVSGVCTDCHTMHASQNGILATNDGTVMSTGPNNQLLTANGCIGCHADASTNATTADLLTNTYPQVDGTSTANQLAGGYFDTTATGAANQQHNPSDFTFINTEAANMIANPPGGAVGTAPLWTALGSATPLSCAGSTNGCHSTGGHHGNNAPETEATGATPATSYRFLKAADGTNYVRGFEDGDYELSATAADHNQYYGVVRAKGVVSAATGTISEFCAGCHEDFHTMTDVTATANWWTRHPTDFDMSDATGTEYASYGGGTNAYLPGVPVASTTVSAPLATVLGGGGNDAIVTCVSCHRAHGSDQPDLLRWDYSLMNAHNAAVADLDTGCFACHTSKDT